MDALTRNAFLTPALWVRRSRPDMFASWLTPRANAAFNAQTSTHGTEFGFATMPAKYYDRLVAPRVSSYNIQFTGSRPAREPGFLPRALRAVVTWRESYVQLPVGRHPAQRMTVPGHFFVEVAFPDDGGTPKMQRAAAQLDTVSRRLH